MNMKFYLDNLKGKDHLGKLGIDGGTILKPITTK
jgi:hypothetical protein